MNMQLVGESNDVSTSKLSQLLRESAAKNASNTKKRTKDESILPTISLPVGSVEVKPSSESGAGKGQTQYASLGYLDRGLPIWSQAGDGDVWAAFQTDAPIAFVADQLRFIGPLLAVFHVSEDIDLNESQSLEDAMKSFQSMLQRERQQEHLSFDSALRVWYRHVQSCWSLSQDQLAQLQAKYQGKEPMHYRLSCIRSESKKYLYTRQQFLAAVGSKLLPDQMLNKTAHNNNNDDGDTTAKTTARVPWKVDLSNFDVEVVLLVRPHSVAIGLSLRPYLQANALTFASGRIPPDITPPYVPGRSTAGFVRLRPTTAQMLLHLANIQTGEILLDPCAGIGTIPIEVMFQENAAVGFGGDLLITGDSDSDLGSVAASYSRHARSFQGQSSRYRGAADLMAWDATNLPFRAGSVDAVVSDLPFGQHCMSTSKLAGFLPLLFGEMARVLQPRNGRMILLCGSYPAILESLMKINQAAAASSSLEQPSEEECSVWEFPCQSIFPCNIGGLLAWVVHVKRGSGVWRQVQNHRDRSRNLVARRAHIASCEQSNLCTTPRQQKFRRIQR